MRRSRRSYNIHLFLYVLYMTYVRVFTAYSRALQASQRHIECAVTKHCTSLDPGRSLHVYGVEPAVQSYCMGCFDLCRRHIAAMKSCNSLLCRIGVVYSAGQQLRAVPPIFPQWDKAGYQRCDAYVAPVAPAPAAGVIHAQPAALDGAAAAWRGDQPAPEAQQAALG